MKTKYKYTSLEEIKGINVRYSCIKHIALTTSESLLLCLFADIDLSANIPSNTRIAKFMGTNKQSISRSISKLISKGFIEKYENITDKEAFESISKGTLSSYGCRLCGYSKCTLDEHHYPIRAKDGGTNTIPLCPNCHRLFHEKTDYNRKIKLTKKAEKIL